jgi:hypothetical protein
MVKMLAKDKKISLNIGGAFSHKLLSLILKLNLNKKFNITVYDGVNNCSWNGGRINRNIYISQKDIEKYNKYNIKVAFTFSNPEINLNDKKGLELLNWLNDSQIKYKVQNEIILINENLRMFLRKNYNFILKFSITGHDLLAYPNKELQKEYIKYYKKLENKYDIIVPKMEHIFQDWFINNLNLQKYELMTNDTCRPDCPYYKKHFEEIARLNIIFKNEKSAYDFNPNLSKTIEECWLLNFNPNKELTSCKTGMDFDKEMFKKAIKLGYKNFKISGRENTIKDIENDIRRIL